jgi:RNA polymerase sigma factor (sigma-70 family)
MNSSNGSSSAPTAARPDAAADRELLRRACTGEPSAWNTLYARYAARFHVLAAKLFVKHGAQIRDEGRRAAVEDLVQSAWQHLIDHCQDIARGFDPARGGLDAYLLVVGRNQMLSLLRSPSRRPWTVGDDTSAASEPVAPQSDPESRAIDRQALRQLQACMERELDPADIELLHRVLIEDEDLALIAQERMQPRNTLDKRIGRARQRLRDCMKELNLPRQLPRK